MTTSLQGIFIFWKGLFVHSRCPVCLTGWDHLSWWNFRWSRGRDLEPYGGNRAAGWQQIRRQSAKLARPTFPALAVSVTWQPLVTLSIFKPPDFHPCHSSLLPKLYLTSQALRKYHLFHEDLCWLSNQYPPSLPPLPYSFSPLCHPWTSCLWAKLNFVLPYQVDTCFPS